MSKYAKSMQRLGCDLYDAENGQWRGECPHCGSSKFYLNGGNGLWDCKACGKSGNRTSFIRQWHTSVLEETDPDEYPWDELKNRWIAEVAREEGWVFWEGDWWIPIRNPKGEVIDLRHWKHGPKSKVMALPGGTNLVGGAHLLKYPSQKVLVFEGEWDWATALWHIRKLRLSRKYCPLWIPGAGTYPWEKLVSGRDVVNVFDADDPHSAKQIPLQLDGGARTASVVRWKIEAEEWEPGGKYDARDWFEEAHKSWGWTPREAWEGFVALPQESPVEGSESVTGRADDGDFQGEPIRLRELERVWRENVSYTPALRDALYCGMATLLNAATRERREPLWMMLVAPPSSGKTLVISALRSSGIRYTESVSTLGPRTLVSGWDTGKTDPGMFATLHEKVLLVKDLTPLLAMHSTDRDIVFGQLRDAYDGSFTQHFGNGLIRNYDPLYFGCLVGVTPMIYQYHIAGMGERFLRFDMGDEAGEVQQELGESSVETLFGDGDAANAKVMEALGTAVYRFLRPKLEAASRKELVLESPGRAATVQIVRWARLIGWLRVQLVRDLGGGRELTSAPRKEAPIRLTRQLALLWSGLRALGVRDVRVREIVRRVAWSTAAEWNLDVVEGIGLDGCSRQVLEERTGLNRGSLRRRLEDLTDSGVVELERGRHWQLTPEFKTLWKEADLNG